MHSIYSRVCKDFRAKIRLVLLNLCKLLFEPIAQLQICCDLLPQLSREKSAPEVRSVHVHLVGLDQLAGAHVEGGRILCLEEGGV